MKAPAGLGIYFLRLPKDRAAVAKRLADHGVRWAALAGPWHDAKQTKLINQPDAVARFADALRARGVEPHLWGYPWHDRVQRFVDDMSAVTSPAVAGWLLDPELGFKKQAPALRKLIVTARGAFVRGPIGLTSYGSTKFPFPWSAVVGVDYGSPQLYTVKDPEVDAGLEGWAKLGVPEVVPSFGFYTRTLGKERKKTAAELNAHFESFIDPVVPVRAMVGWSYRWIGAEHWPVIAKWAGRLDRGVLAVEP